MNEFIALQILVDALEKLHSQGVNTKTEIIRHEQAIQAMESLIKRSQVTERTEPKAQA